MTTNRDNGTDDKSQSNFGATAADKQRTGEAAKATPTGPATSVDNDKATSKGVKIHAYRRTEAMTVDFTPPGERIKRLVKFNVNAEGDVVALVADKKQAARLLEIGEAYREYEVDVEPVLEGPTTDAVLESRMKEQRIAEAAIATDLANQTRARELLGSAATAPKGSKVMEQVVSLTGSKTVTQAEVIVAAQAKSALSIEEWNELQDDEREALMSREVEHMQNLAEQEEDEAAAELRRQAALTAKREEEERLGKAAMEYTLLNGDVRIDLKAMNDKELRKFAKEYGVELEAGLRGNDIRQVLVDKLVTAPADATQTTAGK